MNRLIAATDRVAGALSAVAGIALVAMIAVLVGNIVLRWAASPLHGAYELISLLAVVVLGLGLAQAQAHKSHVAIDIVMVRFGKKVQLAVGAVTTLLSILIFVELATALWGYGMNQKASGSATESLHIPVWPSVMVLLAGVVALVLTLVADLGRIAQSVRSRSLEIDIW